MGGFYDSVGAPVKVGNSVVFAAHKNGESFFVRDGKEDKETYDGIGDFEVLQNELAFVEVEKNGSMAVHYKGKKFSSLSGDHSPDIIRSEKEPGRLIFFEYNPKPNDPRRGCCSDDPYYAVFDGVKRVPFEQKYYEMPSYNILNLPGVEIFKNRTIIGNKDAVVENNFGFSVTYDGKQVLTPDGQSVFGSWGGFSEIAGKLAFTAGANMRYGPNDGTDSDLWAVYMEP